MNIEFEHSWAFILSVLPYLVYRYAPPYETRQTAIHVSFFDVLVNALGMRASQGASQLKRNRWQSRSLIVMWGLLVIAMAKPVWYGEPQTRELRGRDVMVVVDLSGSMAEQDFTRPGGEVTTRLDAAKQALLTFSQEREGDRLGLILFGDAAYLQAPFTSDHQAWRSLLTQSQVAMAGESTHLGDAIGLGIKTFVDDSDSNDKVLLVLTDGKDTGSLVPPIEAAKLAHHHNIRIHVVAMGDPKTEGEAGLDLEVLTKVADLSGGEMFLALSSSELNSVYAKIAEIEPSEFESFTFQPKKPLHFVPLLLLMANYLLMMLHYTFKYYKNQWVRSRIKDE